MLIKKDHYLFGLSIGILIPLTLFVFIYGINYLLNILGIATEKLDFQTHVFISLFGNLLPIRYYFVSLVYEKTGKGVLIITFVMVLLFFLFKDSLFYTS